MYLPKLDFLNDNIDVVSSGSKKNNTTLPELDFSFLKAPYTSSSDEKLQKNNYPVESQEDKDEINKMFRESMGYKIPKYVHKESSPVNLSKYKAPDLGEKISDFGKAALKTAPRAAYTVLSGVNKVLGFGAGLVDYAEKTLGDTLGTGSTGYAGFLRDAFQHMGNEYDKVLSGDKKAIANLNLGSSKKIKGKKLWDNPSLLLNPEYLVTQFGDAASSALTVIGATLLSGGSTAIGGFVGGVQEAASMYSEMKQKGVDEASALTGSLTIVPIVTTLEKFGLGNMLKKKAVSSFYKKGAVAALKGVGESSTEWGENVASEVVKTITESGIKDPEIIGKAWESAKKAAKEIDVLVGAGSFGTVMGMGSTPIQKTTDKTEQAQEQQEVGNILPNKPMPKRDSMILKRINEELASKELKPEDALELVDNRMLEHLIPKVEALVKTNEDIDLFEKVKTDPIKDTKLSTISKDNLPGKDIGIKDIQKFYKNQEISINNDKSVNINFKNGTKLNIQQVKDVGDGKTEIILKSMGLNPDGKIAGSYSSGKMVLDKDYATKGTIPHENYHMLINWGVVNQKERASIRKEIDKLSKQGKLGFELSKIKDPEVALEEDEANLISKILLDRESYRGTKLGEILQKITDFFDGILHLGGHSVKKLARSIESGKVYEKDIALQNNKKRYMMVGKRSVGFDQEQADLARKMIEGGADKNDVWYKKGYTVGLDGKDRIEIDDSKARFRFKSKNPKGSINTKLGKLLYHPELFERYPHLKNLNVRIDLTGNKKNGGFFSKKNKNIEVRRTNAKEALATLMHEIQHAVQNKEGFASGGNLDMFLERIKDRVDVINKNISTLKQRIGKDNTRSDSIERKELANLIKEREKYSSMKKRKEYAFELYQRLHGEAEARATASRKDMPPDIRRIIMPMESQHVPEKKMIITGVKKDSELDFDQLDIDEDIFSVDKNADLAKKYTDLQVRKKEISAIQKFYKLTKKELNALSSKNIDNMSLDQFNKFRKELSRKAIFFKKRQKAYRELKKILKDKDFTGEINLRKKLKAPKLAEMNLDQLSRYKSILQKYDKNDIFFTPERMRELKGSIFHGMKTHREVLEAGAKHIGVKPSELKGLTSSALDKFLYDTSLSRQNPFYNFMVDHVKLAQMKNQDTYIKTRDMMYDLADKALKSRKRSLVKRLVPTQELIMNYLEGNTEVKVKSLSKMTEEELHLADFIRGFYRKAYDYLKTNEDLESSRFKDKYFMHAKKPLSENILNIKDIGFKKTLKEIFKKSARDQAFFKTVDSTGKELGLSKFFKNTVFRSGELSPSKNVIRSTDIYMKQFFKKVGLDEAIPAIDTLAMTMTPIKKNVNKGVVDESLLEFTRQYLNNKKGLQIDAWYKQGGTFDTALRGLNTLLSLRYIAVNIPLQLSAVAGETMAKIPAIGTRKLAKANVRKLSKQGKKIIKKYKSYVGDTVVSEFSRPGRTIGERANDLMYGMLKWNRRQTNIDILLGNMTNEEFRKGEISPEKLQAIKKNAGRWLSFEGTESLAGSTSIGKSFSKFRTWAIPIIHSIADNATSFARTLTKTGDPERRLNAQQYRELYRIGEAGVLATALTAAISPDEDDKSFSGKFKNYIIRDLNTIWQSLSVQTVLTLGVTAAFLERFSRNLDLLLTFSDTKKVKAKKQQRRGVKGMERLFKPAAISQFTDKKK
jgi:hypothetical protein